MSQEYVESKVLAAAQLTGRLGEPKLLKILTPITPNDYKKEGREKPNDSCLVMDLDPENPQPDEKFRLDVPAIMKNELEKGFPKESYVGEVFRLTRWAKPAGGKASPVALVHMKKAPK